MNDKQKFRPPSLSMGLAAVAGWTSHYLYQLSLSGHELAGPAALVAGATAAMQTVRAANDYATLRRYKRVRKKFRKGAKNHGESRFAKLKELRKAKLVDGGNRGIFLARYKGKEIWFDEETSGNLYAPSGGGKTSTVFIPTLLAAAARSRKDRLTATSFLLNDPSGEMYTVCEEALRRAGYDVVVLSSWVDEISKTIGKKVVDEGLTIYSSFDSQADPSVIRDESKFRAFQLIPDNPQTEEKTRFFQRGGRSLIEYASLDEYANGREPNEVTIHEHLMASPEELHESFVNAMASTAFGGYHASLASSLAGIATGSPEQFAGYLGVAHQALEAYDRFSVVGKHVTGSGFDVGRFKNPERPLAGFLMYPGRRRVTHQRMLNCELSYLLEMICADPRRRRVTALIDEAAGCGYIPSLLRFLNEGRKHQLRIFSVWHDLSQAESIYGKAGMKQIIAAGQFLWASGVREPEMCEMLSKLAGTAGIEDLSLNNRSQSDQQMNDLTHGLSNLGVPLIRDIRTGLQPDEALIFYRNLHAIKAKKVPYYTHPRWSRLADKNPYVG